jgi:uncharacterized protein YvpB
MKDRFHTKAPIGKSIPLYLSHFKQMIIVKQREEKLLRKLYFLVSLLPLFGCSNMNTNNLYHEINDPIRIQNEQRHQSNANSNKQVKPKSPIKKERAMLNVVLIKQNPELKYGCEVTSLAMILNYAGVKTDKMDLFRSIKKDPDPLIRSRQGDILRWGNPNHGFVGDMTGNRAGYAVFDQPMINLINKYLPNRALNLTKQPFDEVLKHVSEGYPVVVWTTGDFRLPDRWESWYHGNQLIKTPLDLHAVVLVGYDAQYVYLNDPLSGRKQFRVEKQQFISSWKALNCRAVTYQ